MTVDADHTRLSYLFTDVEGSSRLWEEHPSAMEAALAAHDAIIQDEVAAAGGTVVKGTGDGFMAVFDDPADAVRASIAMQLGLHGIAVDTIDAVPVRIGIHVGMAQPRAGDYYGPAVNRAARLMGIGHGGQILVSQAANDAVLANLESPIGLHSLGEHRLKDLTAPEQVFQVTHPDLRTEFPPLNSLDAFANNLPSMVDSFVGREAELERIIDTIGGARLVTLTGPGGTGKTRLAVEAAARSIGEYPWGAWLVDLAPITDPAVVASAIAESIGIEPQPGRSVVDTLISRLADRGMLIVLDNCDHLLEASAETALRLLEQCPTLKILATSRERLGVAGEHVLLITPLSRPDTSDVDPETLLRYEAAELFVDRAREANVEWTLDDETARDVARIATAVDGLPLAIELAAARTRVLTARQIADRLDQQLAVLGGAGGGDHRHRALRATIDWSYDLMSDDERRLFRCLGVFRGGADYESIEAVCATELATPLLDVLDGLVTKSMILAEEHQRGMRYRLLEPLRQYATEQLSASDEEADAFARHWAWYEELAVEIEKGVRNPDQLDWLSRAEVDYDNLRVALARAYEAGDLTTCISLAGSLSWFMFLHSHIDFWDLWLPRLLDHDEESEPRMMIRLLLGAAQYAWELGRIDEAERHGSRALEIAAGMESDTLQAWAHSYLAIATTFAIDFEAAREHLEAAYPLFETKGNIAGLGYVLWLRVLLALGEILTTDHRPPDLDETLSQMPMVVEGARQRGDRNLLGHILWTAAELALLDDDLETASIQSAEGLEVLYDLGNQYCLAHNLAFAARVRMLRGEADIGATMLSAASSIRERLGVAGSAYENLYTGRLRAGLEERLSEKEFDEAWEEGQRLAIAAAVGLALS